MKKLAELQTAEFVDLLASDAPAPGRCAGGRPGRRAHRYGVRFDHRG